MHDSDLQAKAIIAAALIQAKAIDTGAQHLADDPPLTNKHLQDLAKAVDRIIQVLVT